MARTHHHSEKFGKKNKYIRRDANPFCKEAAEARRRHLSFWKMQCNMSLARVRKLVERGFMDEANDEYFPPDPRTEGRETH